MYRLVQDLARERQLYGRPQATLPDVLLIDVPARFAHPSLPLGRFYPILVETAAELDELQAYLAASRAAPVRPDLFDRRPSALVASCVTLAAYAPPLPDWPWLLVCHWPLSFTALSVDPDMFARAAYTTEAFDTVDALMLACEHELDALHKRSEVTVRLIASASDIFGHA